MQRNVRLELCRLQWEYRAARETDQARLWKLGKKTVKFITCQIVSRSFPGFWPSLHHSNSAQLYRIKLSQKSVSRLSHLARTVTGLSYLRHFNDYIKYASELIPQIPTNWRGSSVSRATVMTPKDRRFKSYPGQSFPCSCVGPIPAQRLIHDGIIGLLQQTITWYMVAGKLIIIPALGHQNKGKSSFIGSGSLF